MLKKTFILVPLSISILFFFSCTTSHHLTCPDYSKDRSVQYANQQAYKVQNYPRNNDKIRSHNYQSKRSKAAARTFHYKEDEDLRLYETNMKLGNTDYNISELYMNTNPLKNIILSSVILTHNDITAPKKTEWKAEKLTVTDVSLPSKVNIEDCKPHSENLIIAQKDTRIKNVPIQKTTKESRPRAGLGLAITAIALVALEVLIALSFIGLGPIGIFLSSYAIVPAILGLGAFSLAILGNMRFKRSQQKKGKFLIKLALGLGFLGLGIGAAFSFYVLVLIIKFLIDMFLALGGMI